MSEGITRILIEASSFYEGIARCRANPVFKAADFKDAYNRLNRLMDRYTHEKENGTLEPHEEQALAKVMEDPFLKGMRHGRIIGEHVQKTRGENPVILLTPTYDAITLCAETCFSKGRPQWCATFMDGFIS
jgi:hypothetical protein